MNVDALPAPPGLFIALFGATFVLHLSVLGLLVASLWARFGAEWGADYDIERLQRASVLGMSMTITLGIPPLLFVQVLYAKYFYSSSISIGYPWLSLLGHLLIGFYAIYLARWRWDHAGGPSLGGKLFTSLTVLCMVLIGLTYSWNHVQSLSPTPWSHKVSHVDVLLRLVGYGGVIAVVSSVWGAWFGPGWRHDRVIPRGAATAALLGAVLLGVWTFQSDYAPNYGGWMGESSLIGASLAASVAGVFGMSRWRLMLRPLSTLAALGSLIGITLQRESYRLWRLAADSNPSHKGIAMQWSPFVMFLIATGVGIGVLIWLLLRVREAQSADDTALSA